MSADNGVALRQLENGKWVGQHFFHSEESFPELTGKEQQYNNLEAATASWREAAKNTEYGFTIVHWQNEAMGEFYDPLPVDGNNPSFLERDLASLLNGYSQENASGTPDFILAQYLLGALRLFEVTVASRAKWRGEPLTLDEKWALEKEQERWEPINVLDIHPEMYVRAIRDYGDGKVEGKVFSHDGQKISFTQTGSYHVQAPGWHFEVRIS